MLERIKAWLRSYWARALFCLLVVFSAGSEGPGAGDRLDEGANERGCLPSQPYSAAIREIVEEELKGLRGRNAVGVLDLGTGEGYLRDARGIYPSASLYKLYVMHAAFSLASAGEISLNDRITINQADASEFEPVGGLRVGQTLAIRDALRSMITISSNAAGRSLLRNLGRGRVNAVVEEWGLRETRFPDSSLPWRRTGATIEGGYEVASTSARDTLCFMTDLARGERLGRAASNEMLQLLFDQRVNDRIPAQLPRTVRVAHKTGELTGVRNDAGIVYGERSRFALVVLSQDADEEATTRATADLSARIYRYFESR